MSTVEKSILQTLIELDLAAKAACSAGTKVNLLPLFAKLDELEQQLPDRTDPELRHFLQRKSYEKARRLLEGRGAENARGSCGQD